MANKDGGEATVTGQSKRPPLIQRGSDSQTSDQSQQHQHAQRSRASKHVVGGGTGGRLHARVPSSKHLHKHTAAASSNKLNRRQASPSPEREREIGAQPGGSSHRRATSDVNLSRGSSATHLKKNSSHTNLKPVRPRIEVGKRSKSSANLKRSLSNPAVHKLKSTNVHFNLGDDTGQDDGQEDEWVDASSSASPLLSRRTSVVSGGQSSTGQTSSGANSRPHSSPAPTQQFATGTTPPSGINSVAHSLDQRTSSYKQYLTSRLLQRTPPQRAPPQMSTENITVRRPSSGQHSPDSGASRESASTLSGTPQLPSLMRPGSSGKDELTSRFVTNNSQESGSGVAGDSFLARPDRIGLARAVHGKASGGPRRPQSMVNLAEADKQDQRDLLRGQRTDPDDSAMTDGDDGKASSLAGGGRNRRYGAYAVPRGEMNRTQQKLDLQRASSSLEPSHHHPTMGMGLAGVAAAAGPLVGGSGFENRDPRLGKLMERTGMEYLVVRRYQNPIARSITRLTQIPDADRARRIPNPGSPSVISSRAHSRRSSEYSGGARSAHLHNLNERDIRDPSVASLISGQVSRRPSTPARGHTVTGSNGIRPSIELDDGSGRRPGSAALSGSSIADRGEDAQTMALLRNLWDKNMDLSASQE